MATLGKSLLVPKANSACAGCGSSCWAGLTVLESEWVGDQTAMDEASMVGRADARMPSRVRYAGALSLAMAAGAMSQWEFMTTAQ